MVEHYARQVAAQFGLDPDLLADAGQALLEIESHGDQHAQSPMNYDRNGRPIGRAQGLMQVMPFHGAGLSEAQMRDPDWNIRMGLTIFARNLAATGSYEAAAAAYFGAYDWEAGRITEAADAGGQTGSGYVAQWRNALNAIQQWRARLGQGAR